MPAPKKGERPHRAALTRMFRATGIVNVAEEAPLVELLRTLADELDAGGGSRPRIEYRSALKDMRQVLNGSTRKITGSVEPVPVTVESEPQDVPVPNDLAAFKQSRGIA